MSEGNTNILWWREENKKNSAKFQTKVQFRDRFSQANEVNWVKNHPLKVSYVLTEWCWLCSPSRFSPLLGGGWMYNGLSEKGIRMEGQQLWLAVNDVLSIRRAELCISMTNMICLTNVSQKPLSPPPEPLVGNGQNSLWNTVPWPDNPGPHSSTLTQPSHVNCLSSSQPLMPLFRHISNQSNHLFPIS